MFFFSFLLVLLVFLFVVLSVAFVTLFERHFLSLSQNRLGPNKVFFFGVVQAVLDGVKLMKKEQILPYKSSDFFFLFMPCGFFVLLFFDFFCFPFFFFFFNFQFSFVFLMCLVGVSVYFIMISSLVSKSKFSYVGGLRSSSQSVSFEIVFSLYLICFMFHFSSFELSSGFVVFFFFLFFCFILMVLAEINRAPFDFSEGESELVSGFNTEFSSITFVLLFLGEYGFVLFFSSLGGCFFFDFFGFFGFFIFFFLFIFFRSVYPRFRYDLLMYFFWKILLPISLVFFFFFFFLFCFSFFFFFGHVYFLDLFCFFFFLQFIFYNKVGVFFFFMKKFVFSLVGVFSYSKSLFMSSFFSFFIFFFLLVCCFGGYFCYSVCVCGMFEFTFFFALVCWLTTFLLFISSEKFSVYMSKGGDVFIKTLVMFAIEIVSEFSRPIALTVRLTVNVLVGHIISGVMYSLFEFFLGNFFFFFIIFSILMECFVFFIQSYIFSRLIFLYLNE